MIGARLDGSAFVFTLGIDFADFRGAMLEKRNNQKSDVATVVLIDIKFPDCGREIGSRCPVRARHVLSQRGVYLSQQHGLRVRHATPSPLIPSIILIDKHIFAITTAHGHILAASS